MSNSNLAGTSGPDTIIGSDDAERIFGRGGKDTISGGAGDDNIFGGADDDQLHGGLGNDKLFGGDNNDMLWGDEGHDMLNGGQGNDTLVGGKGADVMTGGEGEDVFAFNSIADSPTIGKHDLITDFQHGIDKIDLSTIDANMLKAGDQAFEFVKYDASKPLEAGQVSAHYDVASDRTIVEAAVDGVAGAEMSIELQGNVHLTQQDFVL